MNRIFLALFSLFFIYGCVAQERPEAILCGVWYPYPPPAPPKSEIVSKQFSWGEGEEVPNASLSIDIWGEEKTIVFPVIGGPFKILKIEQVETNHFKMIFDFDREGTILTYSVHYVPEKRAIWMDTTEFAVLIGTGPYHLYYKISGPR